MLPLLAVLVCFLLYFLGYKFYSGFLAKSVFELKNTSGDTPAHKLNDGVDYLPTKPAVLFGHHYASIAGLAPILGPAVAVIWGWLPAMAWVVLGGIFVGCVHDFGALVVSVRNQGKSIGQVAQDLLGPRARSLFHAIIFFLVALAMGVFVIVLADMFSAPKAKPSPTAPVAQVQESAPNLKDHTHPTEVRVETPSSPIKLRSNFPEAVIPTVGIMLFAVIVGWLHYKKGASLGPLTFVSVALTLIVMVLGMDDSILTWTGLNDPNRSPSIPIWKILLLAYAFIASVTPVWLLLQSRDYINSFLLYIGIIAIYLGFFKGSIFGEFSSFNAEAIRSESVGMDIIPFVFITIACGAVSGFHALVSSGTTAKQLDREVDARAIGYGGMIGESLLGLTSVVACTIGFASAGEWASFYKSWAGIQGLAPSVGAYIYGTGRFISQLGFGESFAQGFIALIVVSFALTSLDSATRLLRYNIEEIAESFRSEWIRKVMGDRYVSSILACVAIGFFAFLQIDQGGKKTTAGLALWKLFGTTNQLLAGLALLVVTVYLLYSKKKTWISFIPMVFVLSATLWAMVVNFYDFLFSPSPSYLLAGVGGFLIILTVWLLAEAVLAWRRFSKS
ncbi:carbon starvation protein A [Leptospira wolffii]|uniref:carbon starvation CstA family protein n=1 Tax=Leptospira wolffii TaxID=409998 RepID=UPI001083C06D|nr:carbon starvation protein A [Leptospira wolffii]TGK62274.1 carbon starvation protein A [Leptospira wolffii]TGK68208.1 carbon starvation protein A [Leptospira wolffii]TGK74342.1 carbon starvation protein A [Leptospira wolffii]TGL32083.1 carbon starvation protein A [Leptospira wolffii]